MSHLSLDRDRPRRALCSVCAKARAIHGDEVCRRCLTAFLSGEGERTPRALSISPRTDHGDPTPGEGEQIVAETRQPQPITPADKCRAAGQALLLAADQLRDLLLELDDAVALPGSPSAYRVPEPAILAVAGWLEARAGLYGVAP
jgi:hypothetical protein